MSQSIVVRRRHEVTAALRAMRRLFDTGSTPDIQQFLIEVMDETIIHNASSFNNEQLWLEGTK